MNLGVDIDEEFDLWTPELYMMVAERRSATRLIRRREELRSARVAEGLTRRNQESTTSAQIAQCEARIAALSATVLDRMASLRPLMVLHVMRDDGYSERMQALAFDVAGGTWGEAWRWCVHGRKLRRANTLGQVDAFICFRRARIVRRRLDGQWQRLCPLLDGESG